MGINILHYTAGFGCHSPFLLKAKNLFFFLPLSEQLLPDGGDSENSAIPVKTLKFMYQKFLIIWLKIPYKNILLLSKNSLDLEAVSSIHSSYF